MKTNTKLTAITAAIVAALTMVSCQSTSPSASGSAVMCAKCKTVWVKTATTVGPPGKGYIAYRDAKTMTCPDCESAVTTFFKTGSLKHHCAHCGGTLVHCEH